MNTKLKNKFISSANKTSAILHCGILLQENTSPRTLCLCVHTLLLNKHITYNCLSLYAVSILAKSFVYMYYLVFLQNLLLLCRPKVGPTWPTHYLSIPVCLDTKIVFSELEREIGSLITDYLKTD